MSTLLQDVAQLQDDAQLRFGEATMLERRIKLRPNYRCDCGAVFHDNAPGLTQHVDVVSGTAHKQYICGNGHVLEVRVENPAQLIG